MSISIDLLLNYGAIEANFQKNQEVFAEGESANYFYQIKKGIVKMYTYNDEGNELIMGFFTDNDSFGEPPIFGKFPYPCTAVSVIDSTIMKIDIDNFKELIKDNFAFHLELDKILSERVNYKSFLLKEVLNESTEHKILSIIDYFKLKSKKRYEDEGRIKPIYFIFPFTRNELAAMVGLRVETVIRHVRKLADLGQIAIKNRKIMRKY
jgi:CRP-like cAMP-binding protein